MLNHTTNEVVDSNWEKIQNNIIQAANKALGTKKFTTNNKQKNIFFRTGQKLSDFKTTPELETE